MPNVILLSPCEQFPLVTFPCPKYSDQNMQASLSPMDWTCGQASPHRLPRLIYCLNMKSSLAENMRVILGWEQAPTILFQPQKMTEIVTCASKTVPTILPKIDDSTVSILKQSPSRNGTKGCCFIPIWTLERHICFPNAKNNNATR